MERALVLIKPDGVERALIGKVIHRFEEIGLKVVALKMILAKEKQAGLHYAEDQDWLISVGKKANQSNLEKGIPVTEKDIDIGIRIRSHLIKELTRSPIVAIILEGNAANDVSRKIAGATEPRKADPSTIRGSMSNDTYGAADAGKRPIRNIVHVSENKEAANREIAVWFTNSEIQNYKRCDESLLT
ncbi:MAG: nucleoside-diphosphate kinase [Candidatus Micrarchaeaceae archaeon]